MLKFKHFWPLLEDLMVILLKHRNYTAVYFIVLGESSYTDCLSNISRATGKKIISKLRR